eukprot:g31328.t1
MPSSCPHVFHLLHFLMSPADACILSAFIFYKGLMRRSNATTAANVTSDIISVYILLDRPMRSSAYAIVTAANIKSDLISVYILSAYAIVTAANINLISYLFAFCQIGLCDRRPMRSSAYAIVMAAWSTIVLERWKRYESELTLNQWGQTHFHQKETSRPEFEGVWTASPVTGKLVEHFSLGSKIFRLILSQTMICLMIGVVVAAVVAIFSFRFYLQQYTDQAAAITGVINAVQIQVLNAIYGSVAVKLNDYENHRTATEYDNALIAKSFLFKFVNSYNSMFYIAFFKKHDTRFEGCINDDCLGELQKQLATIFVTMLVVNNTMEYFKPKLTILIKRKSESAEKISFFQLLRKGATEAMSVGKSPPELQYELLPYEGTFSDFEEINLQFGYLTLFVVAFPIAPLLAIVNNFVENRVDSQALLVLTRRPLPRGAQNIGTWQSVLDIVSTIAIVTNIAIIIFTSEVFAHLNVTQRFTIFGIVEHLMLLFKFAISYFIEDMSEKTKTELEREEYLTDLLINGKNDAEEL